MTSARDRLADGLGHHSWCKGYDADGTCTCRSNRYQDADALLAPGGAVAELIAEAVAAELAEAARRSEIHSGTCYATGWLRDRAAAVRTEATR